MIYQGEIRLSDRFVTICISLLSVVAGVFGVVLCDNKVLARIVPFALLEVFAGVCIFIKNIVTSKKIMQNWI
mgnify:CR=1 FL=1